MAQKAHLLIVDDEANTLASLSRAFRLAGHEATVCDNAAKALELATEHYEEHSTYINNLRMYMADQLEKEIPGITFNGDLRGRFDGLRQLPQAERMIEQLKSEPSQFQNARRGRNLASQKR